MTALPFSPITPMTENILLTPNGETKMNMAEKLEAIQDVLCDNDLCAEAMIAEIEDIIYQDEEE